jgi:uncharacterized membrane protein YjjB (DUF3815 family)
LTLNVLYAFTFCFLIVDNASIKALHKVITVSTMEWNLPSGNESDTKNYESILLGSFVNDWE